METNKLMRIRLLNLVIFGESKKEDFNESEISKLRKTTLNEAREKLKNISESYLSGLYGKCKNNVK